MKAEVFLRNFFSLFFPRVCPACSINLVAEGSCLCAACQARLPFAHLAEEPENPMTQLFWGRVPIETGAPLFFFRKGEKVQHLIHAFKYKGYREVGPYLGRIHGHDLKRSALYQGLDMVVPVPLHPKKERKRGYNQSVLFGQGLAESLGVPLVENQLLRIVPTASQTRKTRFRRWENVAAVFHIPDLSVFDEKNILLVDDVITTGATLEACCHKLLEAKKVKIWLATIALAQ
ncbi:MAG: phosphoribosyltransferase family protein [Bacteroidales bacterium]|jgi:ComF family protein|nr:phosphoribosyltransferase family protein [Bacteroidales bacterium]NLM92615.1 ComF family protein [Bacteroidales bacterium]